MLRIDLVEKRFDDAVILKDFQVTIEDGEAVAIVGESGIGKSTLLRIAAGIDQTFEGHVQRSSHCAMVFQDPRLLPWRSAYANLALAHPRVPKSQISKMLTRVGLQNREAALPSQLSLGQQRRLSLARAFLGNPEFMILDEPFTSLDTQTHREMLKLTSDLIASTGASLLLVTHNHNEAWALATQVFELKGSPAKLTKRRCL